MHAACQSLRARECNLALAGGVNLIMGPDLHIALSKSRMMAADGRCKAFDAAADGFVRAEGCGVVVLKRLSDALASGDRIRAVLKGSAVNQDGRSSGLTAPNGPSQEAVIRAALRNAGIEAGRLSYIEAHGSGTALGDPIEARAIAAVLADSPEARVRIGSVKSNLGHGEAAAGVAGLIKVALALEHSEIPPHLHFKEPSPHIDWGRMPLEVVTERTPWPTRRRAQGCRGQLVWLQRHQRPRDRRRGAGPGGNARDGGSRAAAAPCHALGQDARGPCGNGPAVRRSDGCARGRAG